MYLTLLKSKIHRATVTGASLRYEGSLTISSDLAALVDLREYEKILVGNLATAARFETYVIYGSPGEGLIELNGAIALGKNRGPNRDHEFCPLFSRGSGQSSTPYPRS